MSRKEDVLFCKIAVSNGLVTQEQAQKCLAVCSRREAESGRWPRVGPLFTKYNLLRAQDVQRIYTAVGKRLGTPAAPLSTPPPTPRGRRARGGGAPRSAILAREERKAARRVDPQTLWMGVGFGLVFIGVVATMLVLWMTSGGDSSKPVEGEPSGEVAGGTSGLTTPRPGAGGSLVQGGPNEPKGAEVIKTEEMDQGFRRELVMYISDTKKLALVEDRPQQALDMFKNFLEKNSTQILSREMQEQVQEHLRSLEELVKGNGGEEPPADELIPEG